MYTLFRFQFYRKLQKSTMQSRNDRKNNFQVRIIITSAMITIIFNENYLLFVKIIYQMKYNELTIVRLIVIMLLCYNFKFPSHICLNTKDNSP